MGSSMRWTRTVRHPLFLLSAVFLVYLLSVYQKLGQLPNGDEPYFIYWARSFHHEEGPLPLDPSLIVHPPLYPLILSFVQTTFGDTVYLLRLTGAAFFGLTLFFLYWVCLKTFRLRQGVAVLTVLLYAINPLVVQGSVLLDIDHTLYPFLLLLSFQQMIRFLTRPSTVNFLTASLIYGVCYWAKATTVLVFFPVACLGLLDKRSRGWARKALLACLAGFVFFITTFWLLSRFWNLPLILPFRFGTFTYYLPMPGKGITFLPLLREGIRTAILVILWIGPSFLFLSLWGAFRIFRYGREDHFEVSMLRSTVLLFIMPLGFYTFLGHHIFGYPKYQVPVMLFGVILIGIFLEDFEKGKRLTFLSVKMQIVCLCLLTLFYFLTIGDPLYNFIFKTRTHLLHGGAVWGPLGLTGLHILTVLGSVMLLSFVMSKYSPSQNRKGVIASVCCLSVIAYSLSLGVRQGLADYRTGYMYGAPREELPAVCEFLKQRGISGEEVFAEHEISFCLGSPQYHSARRWILDDPSEVSKRIDKEGIRAIVYGLTTHKISQIRTLERPEWQGVLREHFRRMKIYTQEVWVDKRIGF